MYNLSKIDEKIKKRFKNTFNFCNNDINKFILLLRIGVFPNEDVDQWENLMKHHWLKKLNIMIYILKAMHYFWLMFLKTSEKCVCHLDPVKCISASALAWLAALKRLK